MSLDKEIVHEMFKTLERLDNNVDQINITLAKQSVVLEEHVKRTNLLEENIKPLQKHVNIVNSLILLLGGILALIGAVRGAIEIIKFLQ